MRILILGNTGFVGNAVLNNFSNEGAHQIFTYSRENGQNLLNYQKFENFLKEIQPEIIINCSAHVGSVHYGLKYPANIFHDNMQMILNIFLAVSKVCQSAKMINLISNCVYPMNADIQKENELWNGSPHNTALSYASVRRMILIISESYYKQYKIKSVNLILPGIYGPGNHLNIERVHALDGIIIRMIKAYKNNDREFEVWGSGNPIREWCYIDDLTNLINIVVNKNLEFDEPLNLGQNKGYSIGEISNITASLLNYNGEIIYNTNYADGAAIKVLGNDNFLKHFNEFNFTDIKVGIKNTIDHIINKI